MLVAVTWESRPYEYSHMKLVCVDKIMRTYTRGAIFFLSLLFQYSQIVERCYSYVRLSKCHSVSRIRNYNRRCFLALRQQPLARSI